MEVLDTTIANVALRYIAGGLGVSEDEAFWVGDDLPGLQRRHPDGKPVPRPAPRPQDLLPDLPCDFHRELAAPRVQQESRSAADVPHPPGRGRWRHGAGG